MATGYSQINSGAAIDGTFDAGADSYFEKARGNEIAAMFDPGFRLGGSRIVAIVGAGYQDAYDYHDFILPTAALGGGTYEVIVDRKCVNASTTITAKIRNVTDSSDAVVGSATGSTSFASETLTFTPTVGKSYRLMFTKSDDLYPCYGIGHIRRKAA